MNQEIQELLNKAAKIMAKTGNKPGTRYPMVLKKIVISLRLDQNLSINEVIKHVGASTYSAREWPKTFQRKNQFNKILIAQSSAKQIRAKEKPRHYFKKLNPIIFNQRVLLALITLLIFESLLFHLFL